MDKFKIAKEADKVSSVNRTIRIKSEYFDKLMDLYERADISFNKAINQ